MKKNKSKSDEDRGKQSKNERIENFLQKKYEFRFNIINIIHSRIPVDEQGT